MVRELLVVIAVGAGLGFTLAGPRPAPAPASPVADDVRRDTVLERRGSGHFLAFAEVNGEPTRFVVDTGADTVALTLEDARRAHVAFDPEQFVPVGRGAGGTVRGQEVRIDSVSLDGKRVERIRGVVLDGADVSLLGQTYLRHVGMEIKGDTMTLR